jgi:Protein of unknown function (DUF3606)
MADDKSIIGGQDRARVAGGEDYEVYDFARRHGVSPDEARDMIKRIGNDRAEFEQEVLRVKRN